MDNKNSTNTMKIKKEERKLISIKSNRKYVGLLNPTKSPTPSCSYLYSSVQQKTPSAQTVTEISPSQRNFYLPDSTKKSEPTTPPLINSLTKCDKEFRDDVPSSSSRSRLSCNNTNTSRIRESSASPSNVQHCNSVLSLGPGTKKSEPTTPPLINSLTKCDKEFRDDVPSSSSRSRLSCNNTNTSRIRESSSSPSNVQHCNSVLSLGPGYKFYSHPQGANSEAEAQAIAASTKRETEFRKPDVPSLSSSRSRHSSSNENSSRTRVSSSSPSNRNKIPIILEEKEPSPTPKSKSPLPPLPESPPSLLTLKIKPLSSSSSVLSSSGKSSKKTLTPLQERLKNLEIYSTKTSTEPTTSKTTITPTTPTATPTATTTTTIVGNDPRKEVESLAAKLKLSSPLYQCAAAKGPHENYSVLSLGPGYKFYSHPQGANSEAEAQAIAAKKAIMKLCEDMSTNNKILPITKDDKIIAQRIVEIVNAHRSGVIEDSIPNYYKKNYNELLPNNWTEILVLLDNMIKIDNCVAGRLITKKTEISRTSPHPLVLPTENSPWAVEITRFVSTREVYGRLSMPPYTELLVALKKDMRDHYSCVVEPATKVYSFHYYAVESCGAWHRVQIENIATIDGKEKAYVFFIDIGDREWMDCKLLYPMLQQFYKIAAQAIKMSVSRLEDFGSCKKINDIACDILFLTKVVYIKIIDNESDNMSCLFWSLNEDKKKSLNSDIIQVIETLCYQTPYRDENRFEVKIAKVDVTGKLFLKQLNDGLDIYDFILNHVTTFELTDTVKEKVKFINLNITKRDWFNKIFLIYHDDKSWLRVIIKRIMTLDCFLVFAIDTGDCFEVRKHQLLCLELISEFLNKFLPQIKHVALESIEDLQYKKIIERLSELSARDTTFSCYIHSVKHVPFVHLRTKTSDLPSKLLNDELNIIKKLHPDSKLRTLAAKRDKCVTNNRANQAFYIFQNRQNNNLYGPELRTSLAGQHGTTEQSDNQVVVEKTIA